METIFLCLLFLIMASFIKCLISNPINKDFLIRKSSCDKCNQRLKPLDLIPLLSFIFLKGKCRYCKKNMDINIFLYEVFSFIILVFYLLTKNILPLSYIDYFIVLILIFISIEDIHKYEINEKLQIILLFLCAINFFSKQDISNLKNTFILVLLYHLIYLMTLKNIGYGDIKLFSILSLNLTLSKGIYLFLYTFIIAGFFVLILLLLKKATKNTKIPLAPYITLAYIIILIQGGITWII